MSFLILASPRTGHDETGVSFIKTRHRPTSGCSGRCSAAVEPSARLGCGDVEKKTLLPLEMTLKHKTTGIVAKATHQKSLKNT